MFLIKNNSIVCLCKSFRFIQLHTTHYTSNEVNNFKARDKLQEIKYIKRFHQKKKSQKV